MISCVIDAMENCDFAIVDILGAFIQADMKVTVYVKLEGASAELLVKVDPPRIQHFLTEGAKPALYVLL